MTGSLNGGRVKECEGTSGDVEWRATATCEGVCGD